jgi:hypothetical protein
MNKIQARNMLDEVVKHFSKNPKELRSIGANGGCTYSYTPNKPKSIGCAIGMYIKDEKLCKKMDDTGAIIDIWDYQKQLFNQLPIWMQKMNIDFLEDIQNFHDSDVNFDTLGISSQGKTKINYIIYKYDLGKPKFK